MGLQDVPGCLPALPASASHHAGAVKRTLLAAGHADAKITDAFALQILIPAGSILEVGITAVNEHIALLQKRKQLGDDASTPDPQLPS